MTSDRIKWTNNTKGNKLTVLRKLHPSQRDSKLLFAWCWNNEWANLRLLLLLLSSSNWNRHEGRKLCDVICPCIVRFLLGRPVGRAPVRSSRYLVRCNSIYCTYGWHDSCSPLSYGTFYYRSASTKGKEVSLFVEMTEIKNVLQHG